MGQATIGLTRIRIIHTPINQPGFEGPQKRPFFHFAPGPLSEGSPLPKYRRNSSIDRGDLYLSLALLWARRARDCAPRRAKSTGRCVALFWVNLVLIRFTLNKTAREVKVGSQA